MNNTSIEFCVEALEKLENLDITYDFVRNKIRIKHDGAFTIRFYIGNILYEFEYDLKMYEGCEAEWCGYFWDRFIKVKISLGIREALGYDMTLETLNAWTRHEDRYILWTKYNPLLKKLFEDVIKFKKKINYDEICELLAVPNLIRIKNIPEQIDESQFEMIKFENNVFYKLDDAEFALILLAKSDHTDHKKP